MPHPAASSGALGQRQAPHNGRQPGNDEQGDVAQRGQSQGCEDTEQQELWRQYLVRRDRMLREALERDLPREKVDLMFERFAVRIPAKGQPLPSPRLGGDTGR